MKRRKKVNKTERTSGPSWKKARLVYARHAKKLLRRQGVIGVDLGIKRRRGRLVAGPCIRVHVERKITVQGLAKARMLPKSIEGVPVDVVEATFSLRQACPSSASGHRGYIDPLVGGCSIGRFGETQFGTLGAIAVDANGDTGALTCAHVCHDGDTVVQPHRSGPDVGDVTIEVESSDADASFARLNGTRSALAEVLNYGAVSDTPLDIDLSDLPLSVELVGGCSGQTSGKVIATDFQGWVDVGDGNQRFVKGMLSIEPAGGGVFARGGDSGAGILKGQRFVGLLFAAAQVALGGKGLATPMSRVLSRLGVKLL